MKKFTYLILIPSLTIALTLLIPSCDKKNQNNEMESKQLDTLENFIGDFALIITGILVDENSKPMADESMYIYSGQNETTLDTKPDAGELKVIEGTGIINFPIEGIEEGGSIKLVDGKTVNPSAKTDNAGRFKFEVNKEFIDGETEIIIIWHKKGKTPSDTKSLPLIDENGKPVKTSIEGIGKVLDLGKIKTLQK